jgi:hypothetical protein
MNHKSSYFHRHWTYIFFGLTPIGKTSNKWVSPQAKFKLELNQGMRSDVRQEKSAQCMKEQQIIFQGAS